MKNNFIYGKISFTLYNYNYNLVFLFYYTWGALLYLIYLLRHIIEYVYIRFNHPFVIYKRDFNDLNFFEKTFLAIFHRKGWFKYSIANIFTNRSLFNYRLKNYPLIFFFHLYLDKMDYKFENLPLLIKQTKYFSSHDLFRYTFSFVRRKFLQNSSFTRLNFKQKFIQFLIIQKILFKKYYNLCSSIYFNQYDIRNTIKLNWLFYTFMRKSRGKLIVYDLSKYSDWYTYRFTDKNKKILNIKRLKIIRSKSFLWKYFNTRRIFNFWDKYYKYNNIYKRFYKTLSEKYKNVILINMNLFYFSKIITHKKWLAILKHIYIVRFGESSVSKHINLKNIKSYVFFYLRKNRIFNKSRYSRNRQLYRTGVYWCLWLNVILVYGLYFLFYRFTFNFGYLWWGILIFVYSTIFSRVIKYNFYNIFYIFEEFQMFFKWLGLIFINLKDMTTRNFENYLIKVSIMKYIMRFSNFKYEYYYNTPGFYMVRSYIKWDKSQKSKKFIYFWKTMKIKDDSIFKGRTIYHWFVQVFKLLTH